MKTFTTTFQAVPVTRWMSPQSIVGTGSIVRESRTDETATSSSKAPIPASSSSSTKSFFGSFFGSNAPNNAANNNSTSAIRRDSVSSSTGSVPDKSVPHSSSHVHSDTSTIVSVTSPFPVQEEIVLYYFTMLTHGGQQGTVYLTPRYICIVSSLMGFMNTRKDIFLFADLTECSVTTSGEAMHQRQLQQQQQQQGIDETAKTTTGDENAMGGGVAAGLFGGLKLLKLVWQNGQREILVRPLLVDANRIQSVFQEIMTVFKPTTNAV